MSILPGNKAPNFGGISVRNGQFSDICLEDYNGYWLVVFFYPVDFGPVAASELIELQNIKKQLNSHGCKLLAISRDSAVVHEQFTSVKCESGGAHGITFPLLEDVSHHIGRNYDMMKEEFGYSFRGYYILNPDGVIRAKVVSDLSVAIHPQHVLRKVKDLIAAEGESASLDISLQISSPEEEANLLQILKDKITPAKVFYETKFLDEKKYGITKTGKLQSPIDLPLVEPSDDLTAVNFMYTPPWQAKQGDGLQLADVHPQPTSVTNNGHAWVIEVADSFEAKISGGGLEDVYRLYKVHCHWGSSEHAIQGQHTDAELHLMHYNSKYESADVANNHEDGIAVVAILLNMDDQHPNSELDKVAEVLELVRERGSSAETPVPVNFRKLLPECAGFYTYKGSYTTPDFRENITWIVMCQGVGVSSTALARMSDLSYDEEDDRKITYNCRPVQPINDREIRLCCDMKNHEENEDEVV